MSLVRLGYGNTGFCLSLSHHSVGSQLPCWEPPYGETQRGMEASHQ